MIRTIMRISNTDLFKALMLFPAILLALVTLAEPAQAAFPGEVNGNIVFASDRTTGTDVDNPEGDREIFVAGPSGVRPTQLTKNDDDDDDEPAWSADGKQIVFHTNRDGNYEIYTMNADGTTSVSAIQATAKRRPLIPVERQVLDR